MNKKEKMIILNQEGLDELSATGKTKKWKFVPEYKYNPYEEERIWIKLGDKK